MEKPTITAGQLSVLLPTSFKPISEAVSPEVLNSFTNEIAELNSRIEAQQTANVQLKADYDTEKGKVTQLEGEKTTINSKVTQLESEVARLKPFENKVNEITAAGGRLPKEDNNSRGKEQTLPENHPNSVALAAFKAANNIQ